MGRENAFGKMKINVIKIYGILCFVFFLIVPESVLGKEIWQSYTASNKVYDVACEGDYIWCAKLGGVFRWDRRNGSYTRYTTVDGLADNHVENVLIASNGMKWFKTLSGVSSFNGASWKSYSEENGLPYYYISMMYESTDGTMWFGSRRGITGFDGSAWNTYMSDAWIEYNDVECILEDSDGIMWFGTEKGVLKYDGVEWTVYTVENGLSYDYVRSMFEAGDGSVWIATSKGLTHIDGEYMAQYLSGNDIKGIAESRNGVMWFAVKECVYRFDGLEWKSFEGEFDSNLCTDTNGKIWYSSDRTIISIDDTLMTVYTEDDGLPDAGYSSIISGADGDLLAITSGRKGIAYFDGTKWKTYNDRHELTYYSPYDVCVDDAGCTWFGMYGSGLWCFDRNEWTQFTADDGPYDSYIEHIMVDSYGAVLCSSGPHGYGVFSRFDGVSWTKVRPGVEAQVYEMSEAPDGVLWLSMEDGVASLDGSTLTWYTVDEGLGTGDVRTILADSKGTIWCGHERGNISKFDGTSWEEIYPDGGGILERWVYAIMEDRGGNIWVGAHNGLGKFDGKIWTFYLPGNGFPEGKSNTSVYDLIQDYDGHIWAATQYGIGHFNGESWTTHTTYYAGDRLNGSSDCILSCAVDKDNNKWFGTSLGGVIKYDGETWTNYTTKDGLCSNVVNSIAIDHNGNVWFGTNNGISVLRDIQPVVVMPLHITELHSAISINPNPFNSSTTVSFTLSSSGFVKLTIYNIMGQKVRELLAEHQSAGNHRIVWDGCDNHGLSVSSGVYISRLVSGRYIHTGRMLLVR